MTFFVCCFVLVFFVMRVAQEPLLNGRFDFGLWDLLVCALRPPAKALETDGEREMNRVELKMNQEIELGFVGMAAWAFGTSWLREGI